MSPTARSILVGTALGLVVCAAAVAAIVWSGFRVPEPAAPTRILVVCAAPDGSGTDIAGLVFVIDLSGGRVLPADPFAAGTVSGTSVTDPREALPFGGGMAVANALEPQTGEPGMEWVVLPAKEWSAMVDDAGGLQIDIPVTVSAYVGGKLSVVSAGLHTLSGDEAVTLASSAADLDRSERNSLLGQLTASVGSVVAQSGARPGDLVANGRATSSIAAQDMPAFSLGP